MSVAEIPGAPLSYEEWIRRYDTISHEDRRLILADIAAMRRRPLLSVVMPAYNTPERLLREAIASVKAQIYPHWELCVADDASSLPAVASVLANEARNDPRVRWMRRDANGHISAATNSALALASGEFAVLMDHDDLLPPHALYEVAAELAQYPDADVIYSDEDKVDLVGCRSDPYFKPAWSPELLAGHNVISHLGAYRRSLLKEIGGLREGFEGSQDWDLALRATAATTPDRVRHVPAVLYHWRWDPAAPSFSQTLLDQCVAAGRRAVRDWLNGEGVTTAQLLPARLTPGWTHVAYGLPEPVPQVSLVTLDGADERWEAWRAGTDWPAERLEIIAAGNGSRSRPGTRVMAASSGTSASALLNRGAAVARGSVLLVLSEGLQPVEPGWLRELVSLACRHEIGVVGAKLVDGAGVVQHGGVILHEGDPIVLRQTSWNDPGYFGQFALTRGLSAIAGGCLAIRREVWDEVGGMDETLEGMAAEVDLCERVLDRGYRIVWTPEAVLRCLTEPIPPSEARRSRPTASDPFHSPNIWLEPTRFRVPASSRRRKPWLL